MKATTHQQKKALTPSMVIKTEKEKNYMYKLSNGTYLEFESKEFPTGNKVQQKGNPNQMTLFY
ncbi:hypothetical protein [Flavobacterium marginilacus]|uniref:hypothetical protein n=1 Tax=Flavobacterium marginilacus TaxID=3003256 RepID=UPI00248E2FD0|nr:hypothetical protein [Flavobacterium marginilacus]